MPAIGINITGAWSVCLSVTLVHAATAVGRNVLLGTDSRVVSAETGPGSNVKRRFGVGTTIIICIVTCGQTDMGLAAMPPVGKRH